MDIISIYSRTACDTSTLILHYLQKPYLIFLLRGNHELRSDVLIEVLFTDDLELESTLLESDTLLVRVLGGLGGSVISDDGVKAGDQHQTRLKSAKVGIESNATHLSFRRAPMRFSSASRPSTKFFSKLLMASARRREL
jgi:hypothetical protein